MGFVFLWQQEAGRHRELRVVGDKAFRHAFWLVFKYEWQQQNGKYHHYLMINQRLLPGNRNGRMTLEEAEALALGTLKQVMEEKILTENVELARVTEERGYHGATAEEVGAVLERL